MTIPAPPAENHRTLGRGLTGTLRGFLYAAAATGLGSALLTLRQIGALNDYLARPSPVTVFRLAQAEEASESMLGIDILVSLVVVVLVIIWWFQAYRVIERTPVSGLSWSAGWAVGGWFIPFASAIIPKLVFNEIDRVSGALEEGTYEWRSRRRLAVGDWWWVAWIGGGIVSFVGLMMAQSQLDGVFDDEVYRTGLSLTVFGQAILVAAALLAASAIRVIGSRLTPPR